MAVLPSCVEEVESVEQVLAEYVTTSHLSSASRQGLQVVAEILFEHPIVVFVTDKTTFDNDLVFNEKSRLHLKTAQMSYGKQQSMLKTSLDYLRETGKVFVLVRGLYAGDFEMRVMYAEVMNSIIPLDTHIRKFAIDQFLKTN